MRTTLLVALLAVACGGSEVGYRQSPVAQETLSREPDLVVGPLDVHLLTDELPWLGPAAAERLAVLVEEAVGFWGGAIPERSRVILLPRGVAPCVDSPAGACWYEDREGRWVIEVRSNCGMGAPVSCPERLPLVHELGHGLIGPDPDPEHLDPRWAASLELAREIAARHYCDAEMPCATAAYCAATASAGTSGG